MKVSQNPVSGSQAQPLNPKQTDRAQQKEAQHTAQTSELDKVKSAAIDAKKAKEAPARTTGAQVEISEQAQLMRKAAEAVHALPDIREDRVAELKERIRSGTYKIDSASVADKLVEEHFLNDFGKNNV